MIPTKLSDEQLATLARDHLKELRGIMDLLVQRGWSVRVEVESEKRWKWETMCINNHCHDHYNGLIPEGDYKITINRNVEL